jgi:hypothetical protein
LEAKLINLALTAKKIEDMRNFFYFPVAVAGEQSMENGKNGNLRPFPSCHFRVPVIVCLFPVPP